jgi:4-amino-4-deoxy-L-arabinose transferase-like glycosyltransferase
VKRHLPFAPILGLLLSLLLPLVVLVLPISPLRLVVGLLLVGLVPGWGLVEGIYAARPTDDLPRWQRLLLGMAVSLVISLVGGLWLYYGLGRLTLPAVLALYAASGGLGFGAALFGHWRSAPSVSASTRSDRGTPFSSLFLWLVALLLFSAVFRFYFLSYSDYRGDEAEVVLRAVAIMGGEGQPILTHTKGPAETLLAADLGLLYGAFNELSVRLPFAIGNLLAVAGAFLVGQRLFGRRVGILAGLLVAINGWFVTYGRTAQYQNMVLPLSVWAMWCAVDFYQTGRRRSLALGAVLLGTASYGHYEGVAAFPAFLYLTLLSIRRHQLWDWKRGRDLSRLWPVLLSLAAGAVVILSFYAPFLLSPTVAGAESHVIKRFGTPPPHNNWDAFYVNALFYDSIYYVLGVGALLLIGTLWGVRRALGERRWALPAAMASLPMLLLSWTGLLPDWYAPLIFLAVMGLFLTSSQISPAIKSMLWWILLPFALYIFVVERPGNHYYVFMPPLMLLAALTIARGYERLRQGVGQMGRWLAPAAAVVLLALFGLSSWHQVLVFLDTKAEYLLTYPRHRNPIFWSDPRYPFDIRIGWGFPYRLGWQTVSELYRQGELAGDWYGTDENNSIYWYTLGWSRNPCYPEYYIETELGYSDPLLEVPHDIIDAAYALHTTVRVNGEERLRLYELAPFGSQRQPQVFDEPASYPTPYLPAMFLGDPLGRPREAPSVPYNPPLQFKPHPDMLAVLAEAYDDSRVVQVQDSAALLGYDIDERYAAPGGVLFVTLYWRSDSGLVFPYKVFAHMEGGGTAWAQSDDVPACGNAPTFDWKAGEQVVDRHAIFLPANMPAGTYEVLVGLYEERTGQRMDLLDEQGNPIGTALTLPSIQLKLRSDQD